MQPGRTCSLNYNSAAFGSPTWVALGRASSPSRSRGRPTSRKTYRSAITSKNVTGLIDNEITFQYVQGVNNSAAGDTVYAALLASLVSGTVMDICMLDQAATVTGATGIRGPFVVSQLDKSEDDEDAVVFDVTLVEVFSADQECAAYTISGA